MNALDLVGILLLALIGLAFMWLGKNATARKLDLNMGRFNADNTSAAEWDAMNEASGREIQRVGVIMLVFAVLSAVATPLVPDGAAGVACLVASVVGPFAGAFAAAKHAVGPSPGWHP